MATGAITITQAVTEGIKWIGDAIQLFITSPAIYFVGLALAGAAAGVARRFVPMKRR